jgi:hypothetical protein
MKTRRQDDWDDDWDDEVRAPEPSDPNGLTTGKIILGLAVVVLLAVIVGGIVSRETYQLEHSPSSIVGTWSCGDPQRSDLWVEFRPEFVVFGTGNTGTMKARIVGANSEQVGDFKSYTVFYRDLAGKVHNKEVILAPDGDSFRFADDPGVSWSRMDL